MSFLIKLPLFAPADTNEGTLPNQGMGKEDVIEMLGVDDDSKDDIIPLEDKKPTKEKNEEVVDEDEDTDDDKVDELVDLEEELKEPTEEELEVGVHHSRREILTKYPKLFKEFPGIEKAIYREQAFTEIFPSVNDAKDAYEKASVLNKFETDLINGNTEAVLKSVKTEDPNAFNKIVDNYLPTLAKVDNNAYLHVVGTIIQHTVMSLVKEAQGASEEDSNVLKQTASILNRFVFGTNEFKQLGKLASDEPKDDKLDNERESFDKQRFEEVRNDLGSKVSNSLKATIEHYIDPNGSMTDFIKRNAIKDAMDQINNVIISDKRFKSLLDSAWMNARKNGYNSDSTNKIKNAYLSRAKADLGTIIKKVRNEALKGLGRNKKEDVEINTEEDEAKLPARERKTSKDKDNGKSTSSNRGNQRIPHNVRTIDFLSD